MIATNNDNLKPKYEDLCKKYYGKSLQEKLEDEKQHRKVESAQVASEFESMINDAFKEVHEKVHNGEGS